MAWGYLGLNGACHSNATVAMYEILGSMFPRHLADPTTAALSTTLAGFEVQSTVGSVDQYGLVTYYTVNNNANSALETAKKLQLQFCDSTAYTNDVLYNNEYTYDYTGAAALWTFAFTTVFSLWYLSKNLGAIIAAVRRL